MRKIANPQELQSELRQLLASTQGPEKPSRTKLAKKLRSLANRVAGSPDDDLYDDLVDRGFSFGKPYATDIERTRLWTIAAKDYMRDVQDSLARVKPRVLKFWEEAAENEAEENA